VSKKDDWPDENTSEISVNVLPLALSPAPSTLTLVQGPGAPRVYDLFQPEIVVGRAIDADLPLNSTDLSRNHVMLKRNTEGQYTVIDLESRNGVYLNGVRVHSALLHDGDSIQLGTVLLVYHQGRVGGGEPR
jgi:pSer/pThr/pTyr-binding forkhead associated (FHA) protein